MFSGFFFFRPFRFLFRRLRKHGRILGSGNGQFCCSGDLPDLLFDDLREIIVPEIHTAVSIYMGDRFIIAIYFFQTVPHSQAVAQIAVPKVILGEDRFLFIPVQGFLRPAGKDFPIYRFLLGLFQNGVQHFIRNRKSLFFQYSGGIRFYVFPFCQFLPVRFRFSFFRNIGGKIKGELPVRIFFCLLALFFRQCAGCRFQFIQRFCFFFGGRFFRFFLFLPLFLQSFR